MSGPAVGGRQSAAPGPLTVLLVNTERGWRGGEHQLWLLVRGLLAEPGLGLRPVCVCQPGSPAAARLRAAGAAVEELAMGGLRGALGLRRLALRHRAALVHAQTSKAHSLAALGLLGTGIPLVVSRRVSFAGGRGPFGRWKYARRVARWAAISLGARVRLLEAGVPEGRIAIIPDGVDLAELDAAPAGRFRAALGLPEDALLLGCVASFTPEKDHRSLLAAFRLVAAREPRAWLALLGDGPLRGELEALAGERVRFCGPSGDLPAVLRDVDVAVLMSTQEGLGSALISAQALGVPAVASRAGGIPEVVADGESGLLVPPGGVEACAEALLRLLGDAGLRARMGAAARARARERFAAGAMVAATAALYRQVLGGA